MEEGNCQTDIVCKRFVAICVKSSTGPNEKHSGGYPNVSQKKKKNWGKTVDGVVEKNVL